MNERIERAQREPEISFDEKRSIISLARAMAPYNGQPVDMFGSYVTHFNHGTEVGFTSSYIPGLPGVVHEGDLFSDNVQVVKRIPELLVDGTCMMAMTNYAIHETSMVTEYMTDVRFFDPETGEEIRPAKTHAERIATSIEEYHARMESFTQSHMLDLYALLDSLDPNDLRYL